jgi:hypothetical protein
MDEVGRLTRKGLVVILALVVLLAAGGAGAWYLVNEADDDDDDVDVTTGVSPSPTASPTATESPTPSPQPTASFLAEPETFPWGDVYYEFKTTEDDESYLNVYFVSEIEEEFLDKESEAEIETAAKDCVEDLFAKNLFAVSCYGFHSLEALEYAAPSPENGSFEYLCWRAFSSKSRVSVGTSARSGPQYEDQGCP